MKAGEKIATLADFDAEQAKRDPEYATDVFASLVFKNFDLPSAKVMRVSSDCLLKEAALRTFLPELKKLATLEASLRSSILSIQSRIPESLAAYRGDRPSLATASAVGEIAIDFITLTENLRPARKILAEIHRLFALLSYEAEVPSRSLRLTLEDPTWLPAVREALRSIDGFDPQTQWGPYRLFPANFTDGWEGFLADRLAPSKEAGNSLRQTLTDLRDQSAEFADRFVTPPTTLFGVRVQANAPWMSEVPETVWRIQAITTELDSGPERRAFRLGELRAEYRRFVALRAAAIPHAADFPGYAAYEKKAFAGFSPIATELEKLLDPAASEELLRPKAYSAYLARLQKLTTDFGVHDIALRQVAEREIRQLYFDFFHLSDDEVLALEAKPWWDHFLAIMKK